MAVVIPGTTSRIVRGSQTGREVAEGFVRIRLQGADDLVKALLQAATEVGVNAQKPLNAACAKAMKAVMDQYKDNIWEVTGNLAKSVAVRGIKNQRKEGTGVAIGGPQHAVAGKEWDVNVKGAGNHAWLNEFGTGRRRPGTENRRTYVNVHQKINRRFTRVRRNMLTTNEDFEGMGRGFYFIMGSRDEPTRQARKGSGYPHDFGPMAIRPGETYGSMPASHDMERAIQRTSGKSLNILTEAIRGQINKLQRAS
jgi:hypothetical protein